MVEQVKNNFKETAKDVLTGISLILVVVIAYIILIEWFSSRITVFMGGLVLGVTAKMLVAKLFDFFDNLLGN